MDTIFSKFAYLKSFDLSQLPSIADVGARAKTIAHKVPFSDDVVALYFCAIDKSVPTKVKASIIAALAYLVLPADFVPDFLVGLGFTDDVAVLTALYSMVSSHINDSHRKQAKAFFGDDVDDPPVKEA
jgi:uncharacterized membrane protein YkvA (DUF1232 family)